MLVIYTIKLIFVEQDHYLYNKIRNQSKVELIVLKLRIPCFL